MKKNLRKVRKAARKNKKKSKWNCKWSKIEAPCPKYNQVFISTVRNFYLPYFCPGSKRFKIWSADYREPEVRKRIVAKLDLFDFARPIRLYVVWNLGGSE
jgi:hypothetical protein